MVMVCYFAVLLYLLVCCKPDRYPNRVPTYSDTVVFRYLMLSRSGSDAGPGTLTSHRSMAFGCCAYSTASAKLKVQSVCYMLCVWGSNSCSVILCNMCGVLCRPYVLPDHYTIPLVPGDFNQVERPCGMLFVTVVSAANVPKMDWFNGSDPYVRYT